MSTISAVFEETDFHYMFNVVWLPPNVASVINHQTLYRPHLHQYLLIWWQKMDVDGVLKYISIIAQERTSKNSTSANKLGLSESLRSHFVYFCREDHCQPPIVSRGALHRMWLCKLFSDLCIMRASSLGLYTFSTARRSKLIQLHFWTLLYLKQFLQRQSNSSVRYCSWEQTSNSINIHKLSLVD